VTKLYYYLLGIKLNKLLTEVCNLPVYIKTEGQKFARIEQPYIYRAAFP